MLRLTRRSEYGIIAMTFLAQRRLSDSPGEDAVSARDIAERYHIPKRILAEVMKDLVHKGLVRSVRGASGGYRIAAAPQAMTVLAVLQALEGPFEMVPCTNDLNLSGLNPGGMQHQESLCELLSFCPIKGPLHKIHEKIHQVLTTVTLADLAKGECWSEAPAVPTLAAHPAAATEHHN
jgi:Rrf2 family protein